jgi:hypothetical protein
MTARAQNKKGWNPFRFQPSQTSSPTRGHACYFYSNYGKHYTLFPLKKQLSTEKSSRWLASPCGVATAMAGAAPSLLALGLASFGPLLVDDAGDGCRLLPYLVL